MITTTTAANGTVTMADAPTPGRSGPAPMPAIPPRWSTELHDLLAAADVPGRTCSSGTPSVARSTSCTHAPTPTRSAPSSSSTPRCRPMRGLITPQQWEKVAVLAIPPDAIPGYELESYDVGTLFDEIEAAPPLPDIPVIVIPRARSA